MSNHIEFRDFQAEDANELPGLFMSAIRTVYPELTDNGWIDDLHDINGNYLQAGGAVIVGVEDESRVAMGAIKRVNDTTGEMKRVAVDPTHQGEGLGQQLLDAIEDRAKRLGLTKIILDTTSNQIAAQHLYEKNGYQLVDRQKDTPHPSGMVFDTLFYEKIFDQQ